MMNSSRVLEQVAGRRTRITDGLAGVRHLVAVASGNGGARDLLMLDLPPGAWELLT